MLVFMNYIFFAPDYNGKVVDYLDLKQMLYQIKADCWLLLTSMYNILKYF